MTFVGSSWVVYRLRPLFHERGNMDVTFEQQWSTHTNTSQSRYISCRSKQITCSQNFEEERFRSHWVGSDLIRLVDRSGTNLPCGVLVTLSLQPVIIFSQLILFPHSLIINLNSILDLTPKTHLNGLIWTLYYADTCIHRLIEGLIRVARLYQTRIRK